MYIFASLVRHTVARQHKVGAQQRQNDISKTILACVQILLSQHMYTVSVESI